MPLRTVTSTPAQEGSAMSWVMQPSKEMVFLQRRASKIIIFGTRDGRRSMHPGRTEKPGRSTWGSPRVLGCYWWSPQLASCPRQLQCKWTKNTTNIIFCMVGFCDSPRRTNSVTKLWFCIISKERWKVPQWACRIYSWGRKTNVSQTSFWSHYSHQQIRCIHVKNWLMFCAYFFLENTKLEISWRW